MTSPIIEPFRVETTAIEGLVVMTMKQVTDERGTVRELFRASAFAEAGVDVEPFTQINATETKQGALRGLHGEQTVKLVAVVEGEAFGAYLDTRRESATHGAVVTVPLRKGTQVLVPAGVCNGFQTVSPGLTQYVYCFTREWVPGMTGVAVNPLDPALGITWPVPVDPSDRGAISAKDAGLPVFADLG